MSVVRNNTVERNRMTPIAQGLMESTNAAPSTMAKVSCSDMAQPRSRSASTAAMLLVVASKRSAVTLTESMPSSTRYRVTSG